MLSFTEKNRKWWILFAVTSCISMIFLDITVLPVALPTIQRSLRISQIGLQWIINAYTLALSVFVLAAGRFGDRFGHKKIFCFGLIFFSLGSILCGASYFEWWFIIARAIQGFGGALLIPNAPAILFNAFPLQQRGKAMGFYVSIGAIFLALGPFVGGLFSEYSSWRFIFWINIPIALIGFCLTLFSIPKSKYLSRHPFDLGGFITSSLGITCIVVALMQSKDWGWASFWTWSLFLSGFALLAILLIFDRKIKDPFIDQSLFRKRNYLGCIIAIFATQFMLIITVFWAIYFQNVLFYSPLHAGLLTLTANTPTIIAASIGGHLLDKHGPRLPIFIGFLLVVTSLFWFSLNIGNPNLWLILSALIPFGCGIPLILMPSFTTAIGEVSPDKRGIASGTATMIRQLGATLSLAVLGSIFLTIQNNQFANALKKNRATIDLSAEQFEGLLSKTPKALHALNQIPKNDQSYVEKSYWQSYINGFKTINFFAVFSLLVGGIFSLWFIRKKTMPTIDYSSKKSKKSSSE